jgi:hypothetical protein
VNPRALLAGFALAALAVGVSQSLKGDETPPVAGDVQLEPSKVAALVDGGTGYVAEFKAVDGGTVTRLVAAECVRRAAADAVTACRQVLKDGGLRDPGALNRFPADASTGAKCQRVACSVYAERLEDGGDVANDDETVIVAKQRDGGGSK